jgi:hypothetical protein
MYIPDPYLSFYYFRKSEKSQQYNKEMQILNATSIVNRRFIFLSIINNRQELQRNFHSFVYAKGRRNKTVFMLHT